MPKYEIKTMQKDIEQLKGKLTAPVKPMEPPEPPKPVEPTKPAILPSPPKPKIEIKKPRRHIKALIPIILIAILLIIGGSFYYWWNYLRISEKPSPEIPASLIEVDKTEIAEIKTDEELFEKLKEVAKQEQKLGDLQRILIKKDYFLSFNEIAEILYINIPKDISNKLGKEYTLFLYAQETENRLGFVIKLGDFENLMKNLKSWEEKMQTDLKPIFLGKTLGDPAAEEFQDNIYSGITIRYLNFPNPFLTIDYAVVGDYLVITTSRESMYEVIDRVLEK